MLAAVRTISRRGIARPARLRTRLELIYRSFSRDGVGVYRKHSYTNTNIGRRIVGSYS